MNKKVGLICDPHVGVRGNSDLYHSISIKWAEWLIEQLKENKIEELWIAGDFFHKRDEINVLTLNVGIKIIEMFNKNFKVRMITGNHDCYYKENSLIHSLNIFKEFSNVSIYDTLHTEEICGKTVSFSPWGTDFKSIPPSDILIAHYDISSFKMNNNKVCENGHGIDPNELTKQISGEENKDCLIFTGHYHQSSRRRIGNCDIVYGGSAYSMDAGDENDQKGWYILNLENSKLLFQPNTVSPKYVKVLCSDICLENVKGNFVRLVVDRKMKFEDISKIMIKIKELEPLSAIVDDITTKEEEITKESTEVINIEEYISDTVEKIDCNCKKELTEYTLEVYNRVK